MSATASRFVRQVVVDAVRWDGDFNTAVRFISDEFSIDFDGALFLPGRDGRVEVGDWIIRDAGDGYSSCTPEVFDATYEPVDGA